MSERLVLTLDGSTRVCGAAVLQAQAAPVPAARKSPWDVVARRVGADGRSQARSLLKFLDEMLEEIGRGPEHLGAVVVGIGPGTFTGVRIAVAGARALSLALHIPVVGVSTLGALAAGAAARLSVETESAPRAADRESADLIVPVIDARRGQVFYGLYTMVRKSAHAAEECRPDEAVGLRYARMTPYGVCDRDSLGAALAGLVDGQAERTLVVAADRALVGALPPGSAFLEAEVEPEDLVCGQELLEEPGEDPQGARLSPWLLTTLRDSIDAAPTTAETTGGLRARTGAPGTPEAVKPIYVRSPDADVHILKMRDPFARATAQPGPGRKG